MSTLANDGTLARFGSARRWMWWITGTLGALLVAGAIWLVIMPRPVAQENTPPPDLDVSRTRLSALGLYQASYTPSLEPLSIDKLHSWTLQLKTSEGQPVEDATVTVHGDMPGHAHGLPTKPVVSSQRSNGNYLVEGMKFQMPGWWYVEFDIMANGKQDTVRFDLVLK